MNKRLSLFLHVAFWAFMFLSPLSFMRGQGLTLVQYLTSCMTPLLMMVIFYINFLWLTPRFFAAGKHRYFLLINLVLIVLLGVGLHYWTIFAHQMFGPVAHHRNHTPMPIDQVLFILRDIVTLGIFAAVATAIILAQRWEHHEKARREAEAARTDAELKTLRNQINPHFLLNTLNNIYALTAFDAPKAQEAIQELSKMLRHLLYDYEQPTVPLKDEVEFLQNYINLMKIRLPESVKVDYQLTIANSQLPVAPMIFISLVENAFKHGVSYQRESFIEVQMAVEGDELRFNCRNSKADVSNEAKGGVGLGNVRKRLDLLYGNNYALRINDAADVYTVELTLPLKL